MLKSIFSAAFIGVLCGVCAAFLNGSVEIFENYVDGVWRHQVEVNSVSRALSGLVVGILAGSNIGFALSAERVNGFAWGTLIGAVVGVLLALAQLVLLVIAIRFDDFDADYGVVATRFSAILCAAVVIGAITGLAAANRSLHTPLSGAFVGTLIGIAFALPSILLAYIAVASSQQVGYVMRDFTLLYLLPNSVSLIAGAGNGAITAFLYRALVPRSEPACDGWLATSIILGAFAAVTASSMSFHYVIFDLSSSGAAFSPAIYAFRVSIGLIVGSAIGMIIIVVARQFAHTRRSDADMIIPG